MLASVVLAFAIGLRIHKDSQPPTKEWVEEYRRGLSAKLPAEKADCVRSKMSGIENRHAKRFEVKQEVQSIRASCAGDMG